ncbi:protein HEADING DATE REPRESSOR 1 [Senna tora]|uniref:Protein HEADING DATE REPRESSOR 1 n=1 Tax=Senna tora TaxID=362788 RepID=A0A834W9U2_9FABA|nr:protein HEADING DATE REPRESSOR 1 [Senna tora]
MEIRGRERKMEDADGGALNGFSPVTSTRIDWKSRRRSASGRNLEVSSEDTTTANANKPPTKQQEPPPPSDQEMQDSAAVTAHAAELSERRKALFEPLEPIKNFNGRRPSAESLLPPPDFDSANYPKGWLIGKKRKLVNVDVVESMRRIAIQEMNRKDREIDGLNEQLEEDARCLEHLQVQLLDEKSKRSRIERENAMLQEQVNMLMSMLQDNEQLGDEDQTHDQP